MRPPQTMDKERVHFNLARLKKAGEEFEVVLEPDEVIKFKEGDKSIDIRDVLRSQHIYSDAKKGFQASEESLKKAFNTTDVHKIAKIILESGEIQFTQEYREALREKKLNRIISLIQKNAIDPKTKLPIPRSRIENAIEQLKLKVKEFETAEQQVDDFVKKMMPLFPIKLEQIVVQIIVPSAHAHHSYGILKKYGAIKKDQWGPSGELVVHLEIPAGVQHELADELNTLCHTTLEIHIVKEL